MTETIIVILLHYVNASWPLLCNKRSRSTLFKRVMFLFQILYNDGFDNFENLYHVKLRYGRLMRTLRHFNLNCHFKYRLQRWDHQMNEFYTSNSIPINKYLAFLWEGWKLKFVVVVSWLYIFVNIASEIHLRLVNVKHS